MDDVDAVHGQIARNMVQSGDWVIAHLDGVPYMEKAPLPYWLIAICYLLMGVHDWVARIPTALAAVLLCFVTARYGAWAFGRRAGFYAGLVLATSHWSLSLYPHSYSRCNAHAHHHSLLHGIPARHE